MLFNNIPGNIRVLVTYTEGQTAPFAVRRPQRIAIGDAATGDTSVPVAPPAVKTLNS